MKYLAIIATRDFEDNPDNSPSAKGDFIAIGSFKELGMEGPDKKLLIWRQMDNESSFVHYTDKIINEINNKSNFELGVIFHHINGGAEANKFRESLKISFNSKLAFCEWYSSTKKNFWNEKNSKFDLPYNNLKKAWKDNNGDKEKTFEAVWDYFKIDPKEENLTEAIFNAIYEQKNENLIEIETAVNKRDNYIKGKGKN